MRPAPELWWCGAAVAYWAACTKVGIPLDYGPMGIDQWLGRQVLFGFASFLLLVPGVFGDQRRGPTRRFLQLRPVQLAGLVSYGVYLWHEAALDVYRSWTHTAFFTGWFPGMLAATVVLSLGVAAASYVIVERPALRLKEKRSPPARPKAAQPA